MLPFHYIAQQASHTIIIVIPSIQSHFRFIIMSILIFLNSVIVLSLSLPLTHSCQTLVYGSAALTHLFNVFIPQSYFPSQPKGCHKYFFDRLPHVFLLQFVRANPHLPF